MDIKFKHLLNEGLGLLALNYFIGFSEILLKKEEINLLAYGITIIITIVSFTIINITNGFLNPIIGLTNIIIKKEKWGNFFKLLTAQIIGSIIGELILKFSIHPGYGYPNYLFELNDNVLERYMTELFVSLSLTALIIIITYKNYDNKNYLGVIHGFIVAISAILLKKKDNLILINPSRYIGMALTNQNFYHFLPFFAVPLIGVLIMSLLIKKINAHKTKQE